MLRKASKLLFVAVLLALASCSGTRYHEFKSVDCSSWSRSDTLCFLFDRTYENVSTEYELSLEVRTDASYSYKNFVARVEILSAADNTLLATDTLCCEIFDDNGNRNGATAGMLYQVDGVAVRLAPGDSDTLLMRVSHIMDEWELSGVCDVGLRACSLNGRGRHQSSEK